MTTLDLLHRFKAGDKVLALDHATPPQYAGLVGTILSTDRRDKTLGPAGYTIEFPYDSRPCKTWMLPTEVTKP